jgi:hypothetical protein
MSGQARGAWGDGNWPDCRWNANHPEKFRGAHFRLPWSELQPEPAGVTGGGFCWKAGRI